MTSGLSDQHRRPSSALLLEMARQVADEARGRAASLDHDGAFPADDIRLLAERGLLHAPFPLAGSKEVIEPTVLLELLVTLGRASLPLARLYEGHVNAVSLVVRYGTAANVQLLRDEADAGRPSAVWMAGDALRLADDAGHHLVGGKILCSGAGYVRRPLVAADSADGSVMVIPMIAEAARAEAAGWTAQGMRATATGTVDFTGIVVAPGEIVGAPGDYLRSPYFRGGAWRVIAAQYGGLAAIFDEYKTQLAAGPHREQPIQLARFGEAAIAIETARLWVWQACRIAEGVGDADGIDAYVDLARNAFERAALEVVAHAQKAIGLKAFMRPNPLERMIRDLSTYLRQPALDLSLMSGARQILSTEIAGG